MRRTNFAASACPSQAASLTDEGSEVLRHCLTGEKFNFHGKRYDFDERSHLAHDLEKCSAIFRKDHAQAKIEERRA
ncbi:hypothetical protein GWG65_23300 [Bradyrhizobium sp. CSA207]|uniref:hypothetical protein n=1 Tax=Bradyrhizobium sp. CSA207 TaxID=2698826 RepID=UPI0023B098A3|nr:hypothetical protein [Bradyrhizobium sp. CSA207]MDE5444322.1 hypothetical protein [Bradyrhizobium sp. CSA207]